MKLLLFALIALLLGGLIGGPFGRFLQSLGRVSGCLGCGWILIPVFAFLFCIGFVFGVLFLFF